MPGWVANWPQDLPSAVSELPRGLGPQDGEHVFGGHVLVLHHLVRRPSHVEVDDVQVEGLDGVVRVHVEEEAHLPSQRRGMGSLVVRTKPIALDTEPRP